MGSRLMARSVEMLPELISGKMKTRENETGSPPFHAGANDEVHHFLWKHFLFLMKRKEGSPIAAKSSQICWVALGD